MTEALVTPEVLTWARERRGVQVPDLASKLKVKPEAVAAWETGERKPTFRQARRLAQALYVPFGYLYLPEPPVEERPPGEVDSVGSPWDRKLSADFTDLYRDTLAKQAWLREYREAEGIEPVPFVGRFSFEDTEAMVTSPRAKALATQLRKTISIEDAMSRATDAQELTRELTRNAEMLGIMVLRSSVVGNNTHRSLDPKEFRGFAIPNRMAPLIFVNARSPVDDQLLTLAHELAHVWINQGGICSPVDRRKADTPGESVEQFCDAVAELSLESPAFHREAPKSSASKTSNGTVMVSVTTPAATVANDGGSSAFCQILLARNGTAFTEAVITSAAEGDLLSREAADLLGIKVRTLSTVARYMFGDPLNLA